MIPSAQEMRLKSKEITLAATDKLLRRVVAAIGLATNQSECYASIMVDDFNDGTIRSAIDELKKKGYTVSTGWSGQRDDGGPTIQVWW